MLAWLVAAVMGFYRIAWWWVLLLYVPFHALRAVLNHYYGDDPARFRLTWADHGLLLVLGLIAMLVCYGLGRGVAYLWHRTRSEPPHA